MIYGQSGASFVLIVSGDRFPEVLNRNTREARRALRPWNFTSFFAPRDLGPDSWGYYFNARGWERYISAGASNAVPDRDVFNRWRGYLGSGYTDMVTSRAYGRGGIRIGASSQGGALQQISREHIVLTTEMNRRGLWPYPPPAPLVNLPGDQELNLFA